MVESKHLLKSKTIQGIVVSLLAYLLPQLGIEVDQSGLAGLVDELVVLAGMAWAIYGRFRADRPIRWRRGRSGPGAKLSALFCVGCLLSLSAAGCAHWGEMSGPERARTFGYEVSCVYLDLYESYGDVSQALDAEGREYLAERVAPALDQLKAALVVYNDAVIAWSAGAEPGVDLEALQADIQRLIADVLDGLGRAQVRYGLEGVAK